MVRHGSAKAVCVGSIPTSASNYTLLFCIKLQIPEEASASEINTGIRLNNYSGIIHGVSLHSSRYAWAERAKQCGYPERFAQEALGHNSKAVHRANARRAQMKQPSLESYERQAAEGRIIQLPPLSSETDRAARLGQKID